MSVKADFCERLNPITDLTEPQIVGEDCLGAQPAIDYFPTGFFGSQAPLDKRIKWHFKPKEFVTFALVLIIIVISFAIIIYMCIRMI